MTRDDLEGDEFRDPYTEALADVTGRAPAERVEHRLLHVRLKGLTPLKVHMWVLAPPLWEDLLARCGFTLDSITLLPRRADDPVVDQLIQARRGS